jgi:DNA-binding NarL/FixJ family response regulator
MKSIPIRVLIADGDPLVCRALSRLLRNSAYVKVIATSADRDEVLELAGQLLPAVALVDAHTARMDGMEVTQSLRQQVPETRVIVLGVYEALREEAMSAGACRFLLKDGSRDAFVEAIRLASSGQCEAKVSAAQNTRKADHTTGIDSISHESDSYIRVLEK